MEEETVSTGVNLLHPTATMEERAWVLAMTMDHNEATVHDLDLAGTCALLTSGTVRIWNAEKWEGDPEGYILSEYHSPSICLTFPDNLYEQEPEAV